MSHVLLQLVREAKAEAESRRDNQVGFNRNIHSYQCVHNGRLILVGNQQE